MSHQGLSTGGLVTAPSARRPAGAVRGSPASCRRAAAACPRSAGSAAGPGSAGSAGPGAAGSGPAPAAGRRAAVAPPRSARRPRSSRAARQLTTSWTRSKYCFAWSARPAVCAGLAELLEAEHEVDADLAGLAGVRWGEGERLLERRASAVVVAGEDPASPRAKGALCGSMRLRKPSRFPASSVPVTLPDEYARSASSPRATMVRSLVATSASTMTNGSDQRTSRLRSRSRAARASGVSGSVARSRHQGRSAGFGRRTPAAVGPGPQRADRRHRPACLFRSARPHAGRADRAGGRGRADLRSVVPSAGRRRVRLGRNAASRIPARGETVDDAAGRGRRGRRDLDAAATRDPISQAARTGQQQQGDPAQLGAAADDLAGVRGPQRGELLEAHRLDDRRGPRRRRCGGGRAPRAGFAIVASCSSSMTETAGLPVDGSTMSPVSNAAVIAIRPPAAVP